ncbi:hypothetical protein GGR50DRAFT_699982 [Xylaria sp. CBS 124048]|nr:hypothetical protein GGR50DRAFT_699982 [Xylaria sp. CBS 124048]
MVDQRKPASTTRWELLRKFYSYRGFRGPRVRPLVPEPGHPPVIPVPDKEQRAYRFSLLPPTGGKHRIDKSYTRRRERELTPVARHARRLSVNLRSHFAKYNPRLKYRKCLGYGGNGIALAYDELSEDGQRKIRSLVVKIVFTDGFAEDAAAYQAAARESSAKDTVGPPGSESRGEGGRLPPGIIITEMLENGDLAHFLSLVRFHEEKIPNAILWRLLLCLVRMCIGMAYPPDFWHPGREGPITETLPDPKEFPSRIVHFDFDPYNIFVGDIGSGHEHPFSPILKEQFTIDWNYIAPDSNTVHNEPVAGNYDVHTNIWGVGYVLESLITLAFPAQPPKPTQTTIWAPDGREDYHTYGAHLTQDAYAHVDRDLIAVALRCQAHFPHDRPTLRELEHRCMTAMTEREGRDPEHTTHAELVRWARKILYEPPPDMKKYSAQPRPEMEPVMRPVPAPAPAPDQNPERIEFPVLLPEKVWLKTPVQVLGSAPPGWAHSGRGGPRPVRNGPGPEGPGQMGRGRAGSGRKGPGPDARGQADLGQGRRARLRKSGRGGQWTPF